MAPTSNRAVRNNIHQTPRQAGESIEQYSDRKNEELGTYLTQQLRANPSFDVGPGFHVAQGPDGPMAVPTEPAFLYRHPWLIPLMGAGAGIGLGAAAGTGLLAGGAATAAPVGTTAATTAGLGQAAGDVMATGIPTAAGVGAEASTAAVLPSVAAPMGGVGTVAGASGLAPGAYGGAAATSSILTNAQRAQQVGQVINGINKGRQEGREAEGNATNAQDRNATDRYRAETASARLNLDAPQERASTAMRGDILANAQPLELTGRTQMIGNTPVPQTTGGISPALFSDQTRELGRTMTQQALQQQQTSGGNAQGPAPALTPLPRANGFDTALGIVGQAASLYGAYTGKNPETVYPYPRRG